MTSISSRKNWSVTAVLGLLLLAGTLVLIGWTIGCSRVGGLGDPPVADQQPAQSKRGAASAAEGHKVRHADQTNFQELVLKSTVPVLVDFYADWCGPCKALGPVLEQVARETAGAAIVKVNVDNSPDLAAEYKVNAIPSLIVFKDGQVVAQHVGMASKARLTELLSR